VDAVVIALTDPSAIKRLSESAVKAWRERGRTFGEVVLPWADFYPDVTESVKAINVSHRPEHKVNGPLHEETNYAFGPERDKDGRPVFVHIRKPLAALGKNDVEAIVDPAVRQAVADRLAELDRPPATAFADPRTHPHLTAGDGRRIPIHKVRIRKKLSAVTVGRGARERHVAPGSNHHMLIVETADRRGRPEWEGGVVTRLEAMRRLARREPVVQKDDLPPGERFVCTLCSGDTIELDEWDRDKNATGNRALYVVRSVYEQASGYSLCEFVRATDARRKADIKAAHEWFSHPPTKLHQRNCRKVIVTPLGEVRYAND
jgi:hypothetical protein